MGKKPENKLTLKGSDIKARDFIHYDHIVHRSGTGIHKSKKAYSRKNKREDASFFCIK